MLLRSLGADRLIHFQCGSIHRPIRRTAIENDVHACAASSSRVQSGVWPNSVMFARIGTPTALRNSAYMLELRHGFGKNHVRARSHIGLRSLNRRIQAFTCQRVGPRHDHKAFIRPCIYSRLDAIDHLFCRHQFFAWPMAAAFGAYLVFHVHCGRTCLDHRTNRARNVERAAPAGIDIDQQRQAVASVIRRTSISTSSMVLMPRSGIPSEFAATPPPER